LSDRNPKFSVAVRASADGRFTFEIFTVSGEPQTIEFESRYYSSPGDAERAGYEAIAANGLQTLDIDKARRAGSGQEFNSSPDGESGQVVSPLSPPAARSKGAVMPLAVPPAASRNSSEN
jgi:hypothetical protein